MFFISKKIFENSKIELSKKIWIEFSIFWYELFR